MALSIDDPTFNPSIHQSIYYPFPPHSHTRTQQHTTAQRPSNEMFKETAIHFRLTLKAFNQMAISKSEQSLAEHEKPTATKKSFGLL